MTFPNPQLMALLEKHDIDWETFSKQGRPAPGVRDKRVAIVTELHSSGLSWADMMTITGLSNGGIQRLTGAMWNPASRVRLRTNMKKVGASWKGKSRPGQLEAQWAAGNFDSPSTRAKYSMTALRLLQKYPQRRYPQGIPEIVRTIKGEAFDVRVRSSYEKKAIAILDQDPQVVSYRYEPLIKLTNGKGILPDFVVLRLDGTHLLIEVKPAYVLKEPQRFASQIARLKLAGAEATRRGWSFEIWTEKELGL